MTEVGAILGTAAYMSPEQAKGKAVDKRADIWAFGCVLYEMLTGRRAFGGDDITDILTAIMRDTPEWTTLPTGTPPGVRHVLRRCLERDARNRLHDIADARIEIGDQINKTDADPPTAPQLTRGPRVFAIAGWLLAIAMAGVMLWARPGRETTPASRTAYRFTIPQPGGNSSVPAISPNGRFIAYATAGDVAANSIEGVGIIQVRALDEAAPRLLAGTEGAREPFWSPDSRTLAFFTADALKRVSVSGGQVERLAALPRGWPAGTWSRDGTILVEITENPEDEGWYVLSAGASVLRKIRAFPENRPTNPDKAFPTFLPDGDHFLFTHPVGETPTVQVGSVSSADTRALVMSDTRPFYAAPGFLLYMREGTLFAQRFDAHTLTTAGEPAAVADNVDFFAATGEASVSVSQEGTLVIRHWPGKSALQWFDRKGQPGSRVLDPDYYEGGAISPDGQRLVTGIADPRRSSQDLWVIDLERNVSTRLTSSPRSEWGAHWAPDGNRIVFSADWNGPPNLYVSDAATVAPKVLVPFDRTQQYAGGWTPDGRQVLYTKYNDRYNTDVWAIDVSSGERRVVLATEFNEETPTPAPTGQWLASVSNASGREEVYLRAFPGGEWQLRLSTDGGRDPVWRRDGKEIFYYQPDGAIMAVTIAAQTGGRVRAGVPTRLFAVEARLYRSFTVAPDGQRFLLNLADPAGLLPPDEVIVDWTRLVTR
jgi:Tol biopolymer transport system component